MTNAVQMIRVFVLVEAASFVAASLVHAGKWIAGHEHRPARIAEGGIGAVLIAGLIVSLINPAWTGRVGMIVQGFALLGTLVGLFTIIVGVGPRTTLDLVYHPVILAILVWGFLLTLRARVP